VYTISSGTSGCAFAAASVFHAVSYVGLLPPTTAGHGGRPSSHAPPRGQQRSAAVAGRNEPVAHEYVPAPIRAVAAASSFRLAQTSCVGKASEVRSVDWTSGYLSEASDAYLCRGGMVWPSEQCAELRRGSREKCAAVARAAHIS